jgi:hypothetical protein
MAEETLTIRPVAAASSGAAKLRCTEPTSSFHRLTSGVLKYEPLVYVGCVMAAMVPLLLVDRFPSQDGPAHLYVAYLLQSFWDGASDGTLRHFVLSEHLEPNFLVYPLLYLLMQVFPVLLAEKIFIGAAWLALAAAARYAVTFRSTDDAPLAFLFLPFGFGLYLHIGFYNFFLGTIFYIAITGFLLRRRRESGIGMLLIFSLLSLLTVVTHLFAWGALLLTLAGIVAGDAFAQIADRSKTPTGAFRALTVDGMKFGLAALPSMVIAGDFLLRHTGGGFGAEDADGSLRLLFNVVAISPVHAVSAGTLASAIPYVLLVWTLVGVAIFGLKKRTGKLTHGAAVWLPLALLMALYFGPHLGLKDFSAQERLLPFAFTMIFLTIAFLGVGRTMKAATIAVITATVLVGTVQRGLFYADADVLLDAYVEQFSEIEPGTTLFAPQWTIRRDVVDGKSVGMRVNVMQHASTILAMKHQAVDLSVTLLSPSVYGYFPVHYSSEGDFFEVLRKGDEHHVCMGAGAVENFIFWPTEPVDVPMPPAADWLAGLFERVRTSHVRISPAGDRPALYWKQDAVACEAIEDEGPDATSQAEVPAPAFAGVPTGKDAAAGKGALSDAGRMRDIDPALCSHAGGDLHCGSRVGVPNGNSTRAR